MNYRLEIEMGREWLTAEQQAYIDGMNAVIDGLGIHNRTEAYTQIFLKMIMFKEKNRRKKEQV